MKNYFHRIPTPPPCSKIMDIHSVSKKVVQLCLFLSFFARSLGCCSSLVCFQGFPLFVSFRPFIHHPSTTPLFLSTPSPPGIHYPVPRTLSVVCLSCRTHLHSFASPTHLSLPPPPLPPFTTVHQQRSHHPLSPHPNSPTSPSLLRPSLLMIFFLKPRI